MERVKKTVQEKKLQREAVPTIGEILEVAGLAIHDEALATKTFNQQPAEINELLTRAGLAIHDEAPPKKKLQQKAAPTIGEILEVAGLTIQDEAIATKTFKQQPISEIHDLLIRAGLAVHEEAAPKHCWEILDCPLEKREACPLQAQRYVPSWVATEVAKCERVT